MKNLFLSFLMLVYSPIVITITDYYCGEGVIFDDTTRIPFAIDDYYKSYTPTTSDIIKAEKILFENYYSYRTNVLKHFKYDEVLIKKYLKEKYKNPKNVKKKYKHYNRQYLGYITNTNDTIVYIGLLNFKNKKKAEEHFQNWKERIIVGFGDFSNKNIDFYNVNLTKKDFVYRLEVVSPPLIDRKKESREKRKE